MASRPRRSRPDCPLRGAGKPLSVVLLATAVLVAVSLVLQGLGVIHIPAEDGDDWNQPSPPPRSVPLAPGATPPAPAPRASPPAPAPRPSSAPEPDGVLAEVVRVVDGDTARVRAVATGEELTLRFIGLDTPETVHPGQPVGCYGPEATVEAKRLLPAGAKVRLVYDESQGLTDYYGRTLVYLHLPGGMDFAEHMIATGHGKEFTYRKRYARTDTYRAHQAAAREAGRGLWGTCATGQ